MNNEGEMLPVRPYAPDENGVNFDEQQLFIVRRQRHVVSVGLFPARRAQI